MQNFADQLSSNPQAKQLLENQKAIRQMLANPETRKVLQSLQKKNVGRLQAAAQSALQGDTTALSSVLQELSSDPQAAKAMEQIPNLKGCDIHSTVILSSVDADTLKKLGMYLTCEPTYEEDDRMYHKK